jgi:hypothetical protein
MEVEGMVTVEMIGRRGRTKPGCVYQIEPPFIVDTLELSNFQKPRRSKYL